MHVPVHVHVRIHVHVHVQHVDNATPIITVNHKPDMVVFFR